MSTKIVLAGSPHMVIVKKGDTYYQRRSSSKQQTLVPLGENADHDLWEKASAKWGLRRVCDADGKFSPDLPESTWIPSLKPKCLSDGELVYVASEKADKSA